MAYDIIWMCAASITVGASQIHAYLRLQTQSCHSRGTPHTVPAPRRAKHVELIKIEKVLFLGNHELIVSLRHIIFHRTFLTQQSYNNHQRLCLIMFYYSSPHTQSREIKPIFGWSLEDDGKITRS